MKASDIDLTTARSFFEYQQLRRRLATAQFESIPYEHRIESRIYSGKSHGGSGVSSPLSTGAINKQLGVDGATGLGIHITDMLEKAQQW